MAIIDTLENLKFYLPNSLIFNQAIDYLEKSATFGTDINSRIANLHIDAFERININEHIFALEQKFYTKNRNDCFLESHKKYVDIQLIIDGEELMEHSSQIDSRVITSHNKENDMVKYKNFYDTNKILLKPNEFAIYFPQDIHMGCQKFKDKTLCLKTVLKVPFELFK